MADFVPNVTLAALLARPQAHAETRGAAEERSTSRGKRSQTRAAMASGYGVNAPMGRCYPIFLSLSECAASSKNRDACDELRDDYMECLHHKKEVARLNASVAAAAEGKEAAAAAAAAREEALAAQSSELRGELAQKESEAAAARSSHLAQVERFMARISALEKQTSTLVVSESRLTEQLERARRDTDRENRRLHTDLKKLENEKYVSKTNDQIWRFLRTGRRRWSSVSSG